MAANNLSPEIANALYQQTPQAGGLNATNYPNPYGLRAYKEKGKYEGEMMPKSTGWLGVLKGPRGEDMTEFSLSNEKGETYPSLVPTLNMDERMYISKYGKTNPAIERKAAQWHETMKKYGRSSFFNEASDFSKTRAPYPDELTFFKSRSTGRNAVPAYAADDDHVVFNPFMEHGPEQRYGIYLNEGARIKMRNPEFAPTFDLTPEQEAYLDTTDYAKATPEDRRATIAARLLSKDQSAGTPTKQQLEFVKKTFNR
jgi:hypothetical protein